MQIIKVVSAKLAKKNRCRKEVPAPVKLISTLISQKRQKCRLTVGKIPHIPGNGLILAQFGILW